MTSPLEQTPGELVFEARVPFSWTRRWAATHATVRKPASPVFLIHGTAAHETDLAAVVAFARDHDARLTVTWSRVA
jgi:hypothetical protein